MTYSVYSDFNIEQHKKTFIHYLEVVIDENGKIMYAVPSHREKMIRLACEKLNVTREELNAMCPQEYYFDLMTWLCKMSSACAVWENFIQCDRLTEQQIRALQMLKENGLYLGEIQKGAYMGIFKDNLSLGLQYAFLINLGFKYEKSNGINGKSGYVKSINHNEIEVLWITVNPQERKVHLYNEWDCGGELWQREYDIPQDVLESESEFVDWLDEKIGDD